MTTAMAAKSMGFGLLAVTIQFGIPAASVAMKAPAAAIDRSSSKFHDNIDEFVVNGASEHRSIDCHRHGAVISGASNTVELRNCAVVRVTGASNTVRVIFSESGTLRVTGSSNEIEIIGYDGVRVDVSDNGTGNRIHRR